MELGAATMYSQKKLNGKEKGGLMNNKTVFIPLLLCLLFIAGCLSNNDVYIPLEYIPQKDAKHIDNAGSINVLVSVVDKRIVKDRVRSVMDQYGYSIHRIAIEGDVPDLLKKSLESEFVNRGFQIRGGGVNVDVTLIKFINAIKYGVWSPSLVSEFIFNVEVKGKTGQAVFSKEIQEVYKLNIQVASAKNTKLSLEGALKGAIKQLTDDSSFIEALSR